MGFNLFKIQSPTLQISMKKIVNIFYFGLNVLTKFLKRVFSINIRDGISRWQRFGGFTIPEPSWESYRTIKWP